jgi:hypothetical protein
LELLTGDIERITETLRVNVGPHARAHVYRVGDLHVPPSVREPCSVVLLIDDGAVAPAGPVVFGRAIREWVRRRAELVLVCAIPMPIAAILALACATRDVRFNCCVIATPAQRRKAWLAAMSGTAVRLIGFPDVGADSLTVH